MGEIGHWTWLAAGIAACVGGFMGLYSLIKPSAGAAIVRLAPDPGLKGGWAEFRSSYGGALVLMHGAVLLTLAMSFQAGAGAVMGASFAVSLYWLGMAIGRAVSMVLDRDRDTATSYNAGAIGFETVMAMALGAPFVAHLGG